MTFRTSGVDEILSSYLVRPVNLVGGQPRAGKRGNKKRKEVLTSYLPLPIPGFEHIQFCLSFQRSPTISYGTVFVFIET